MSTYRCYAVVTGSKYLGTVEADTAEEAQEKALELDSAYISLCHQCSHQIEDPQVQEVVAEVDR